MPDPTTPPHDTPAKPKASELLADRDREIASLKEQLSALSGDLERHAKKLYGPAIDDLRARAENAEKQLKAAKAELADIATTERQIEDLAAARAAEREKAIKNKEPPKLIGTINVYLQDMPADIVERAQPLFAGRVPLDRATKFRIDGNITVPRTWPLYKRLGHSPKVGSTFDRDEMPAEEIAHYAPQGVIVPVA